MRIVWLFDCTDQLRGGVMVALTDANWLFDLGHEVTVVSRTAAPAWMELRCAFQQVTTLTPEVLPPADVVIATSWTTVETAAAAARANGSTAVHFCQGYEGDAVEDGAHRKRIEAAYRLPVHHVTIASHLTRLLRERFGIDAHEIVYAEVSAALREGGLRAAQRYTQEAHGRALLRVLDSLTGCAAISPNGHALGSLSTADDDLAALTVRLTRELRRGAERLDERSDHERAAAFRAAAHCLCPGDAVLAADAAWSMHLGGNTQAALRMFDELVADGFDHVTVHERRAFLLNSTGQPAAAAQALRAAIAAGLRNADAYNNLGVALYRTGDFAGARSSFERALVIEPDHQDAQANVADLPVG